MLDDALSEWKIGLKVMSVAVLIFPLGGDRNPDPRAAGCPLHQSVKFVLIITCLSSLSANPEVEIPQIEPAEQYEAVGKSEPRSSLGG